jgi:signal transduction histidine kinase
MNGNFSCRDESVPARIVVAESLQELSDALSRFDLLLRWLIPGLLALAGVGWLPDEPEITAASRPNYCRSGVNQHPQSVGTAFRAPIRRWIATLAETLNRMLARLNESVQRMSQFTADASHALRTPVALIRTTPELAIPSERCGTEAREDMLTILTEAERVSRIDSLFPC